MSVLYPYTFLNRIEFKDIGEPAYRYTYKFENHRSEIKRLKHHEKDFLFRTLKMWQDANDQYPYDLFKIPEAKEFLFHYIILTHSNQVMVFDGPIIGPYGLLKPAEKRRNKRFFYECLNVWKNQINEGKGVYFSVIKPEMARKMKGWRNWAGDDKEKVEYLKKKEVYIYATFFHIYYHAKLYFDERPHPYVLKTIGGFDVVFNTYSFVHILSRHYYPNMNEDLGITLNTELECMDLDYLPDEIFPLIDKYNKYCPLNQDTEDLLFSFGSSYYILWLKYKVLNETKKKGFEVRSFYKCEEQRNLDKKNRGVECVVEI